MTDAKELSFRVSEQADAPYLSSWLNDPEILTWYPMCNEREIEDSVRIWISYGNIGSAFTAVWNGVPCGMALLYIQPFKKLAHQALFAILVDKGFRNRGVGGRLIEELIRVGKEKFHLEMILLEVYEGNPAINLYRRLGFQEYGCQAHFIKEMGKYRGKIFMQKQI